MPNDDPPPATRDHLLPPAQRGARQLPDARHAHLLARQGPGHPGARITTIDLKGATANATVTAPGGIESDIELQKVTGTWKIANF